MKEGEIGERDREREGEGNERQKCEKNLKVFSFSLIEKVAKKNAKMPSLPRASSSSAAARAALPPQLCAGASLRLSMERKPSSMNAPRGQRLDAFNRRPMLTTQPTRTQRSTSTLSSSLPPAATELLSAAFTPATPGLLPSLAVNAIVFTLGSQVLSAGLTPPAVAASFLLGTLSFAAFGWRGYLIVCGYFIAGSAVTKLRLAQKQAEGIAEARGGRRAPGSVMGSGLAGALASAAALVLGRSAASAAAKSGTGDAQVNFALCATAFVSSFASKLADTASSEVGKAFGTNAYLSTTLKKVPRGTEGAVSTEGSLAGLVAAAAVTGAAVLIGMIPPKAAVAACLAAVAANVFESWLGATAQSGREGAALKLSNDAVNAIQICVAAGLAAATARAFGLV